MRISYFVIRLIGILLVLMSDVAYVSFYVKSDGNYCPTINITRRSGESIPSATKFSDFECIEAETSLRQIIFPEEGFEILEKWISVDQYGIQKEHQRTEYVCVEQITRIYSRNGNLEKIIFPSSLRVLNAGACRKLANLKTVVFNTDKIGSIESNVFYNCTSLTDVNIPVSVTIAPAINQVDSAA